MKTYFSSLYDHVQKRRYARPINHNNPNKLFKPLYDYSKTKTTDIDLRPSYYKFMENMEKTNPDLFKELNDPIPTEDLIDMNYLQLHENRHVPKIMPDEEYPDWV